MMKKLVILSTFLACAVFFVAVLPSPAQKTPANPLGGNLTVQDAGTCSTTGSFLWQQLPSNASTTTVNLAGTFSGTLTIRLSNNGGGTWTTNTTTTSVGNTTIVTNSFTDICADVTTFTSGVFQVTLSTGVGVGVPALVGGPLNAVQFNNPLGTFAGSPAFTFAPGGTNVLTVGQLAISFGQINLIAASGSSPSLAGSTTVANQINVSGALQAGSGLVSGGSLSLTGTGACATFSATAGGAWAGSATCSGTTGAATVVITPGPTAPHFWGCFGSDLTHLLNGIQSGFSATTCTLSFTSVTTSDNVQITAFAY